ncbi:MAG TPA: hypothetical protein VK211_25280, partial [Kamptonema sp.]|nr:hypothetical protein [Kamptonema sp.]
WSSAIGLYREQERFGIHLGNPLVNQLWNEIHYYLARELGLFNLGSKGENYCYQCQSFLLNKDTPIDNILDLIEVTFRYIDKEIRELLQSYQYKDHLQDIRQLPDEAISELNHRFREHGIGYQYNNGQIIRVDSGFIHAEVVVPALSLLSSQQFKGAEQEFRSAHQHYRNQKYKEAIVDALKAFESTMKTICDECTWSYDPQKDSARKLIDVVLKNELVPLYLQNHLSSLRSVLEGVPTIRNQTSGHGQGSQPISVPEHLAAFALHLTASNIVLLVEAYKAKQSSSK